MRAGGPVACPGFDRAADRTLPGALRIRADTRIVLVEGNYLTLTTAPWSGLARFFDLTVALDLDRAALAARLIRRWRDHGLTEAAARARVAGNDLPNADTVARRARAPDFLLRGDAPRAKGPDRHR